MSDRAEYVCQHGQTWLIEGWLFHAAMTGCDAPRYVQPADAPVDPGEDVVEALARALTKIGVKHGEAVCEWPVGYYAEVILQAEPRLRLAAREDAAQPKTATPPVDVHPEAFCQRCRRPNPVWSAPNDLWNEVMDRREGIVCPSCFAEAAEAKGIAPIWRFAPVDRVGGEGLDVERLRKAIDLSGLGLIEGSDPPAPASDFAPQIAREYAAHTDADCPEMRTVIEAGIEAFRLTREYVGPGSLPAIEGWSWFDWTETARAALADKGGKR